MVCCQSMPLSLETVVVTVAVLTVAALAWDAQNRRIQRSRWGGSQLAPPLQLVAVVQTVPGCVLTAVALAARDAQILRSLVWQLRPPNTTRGPSPLCT